ncbi:MAG: M1 family aminopeptidase [Bacteroidota bacterium]|nr:M1 family aminopeptidase [Bacteroidota bacterium]MDP4241370.1 M1 family aminopeptidase [Bacteroidota bacterium]
MRSSLQVVLAVFLLGGLSHRATGQIPAKGYHAISYNATVKLDRQADSLWGVVTMTGRTSESLTGIRQYALYIQVDSVFVNGSRAVVRVLPDSSLMYGGYFALSPSAIDSGNLFTVTTYYHGKGMPEQQGTLHWGGVTDEDTMMFAMGVGFNAPYTSCTRHWMPCYDLPDDKPDSVDLTFICRDSDVTASNGLLVSNTVANGWRTMHWHISHPIATYLLTFATGPYTIDNVPNSLNKPFQVFALQRDSAKAAVDMRARVRDILAFYDSLFGTYPFEKVGYVITPIGSMEHQTMISLDKGVLIGDSAKMASSTGGGSTTAIHELAHQWWGDWVTCKTFDDAWLNEGFATYCEALSLEHLFGRSVYLATQHSNIAISKYPAVNALPLFGAATADNHSNNYPSTIYQKGAAVLGMLRQYLGDSTFFKCVRYYGRVHAYSTATSFDMQQDFKEISGQDLSWFWKEWVYGIGFPKDTIVWYRRQTGAPIEFHQKFNNAGMPYFRVPIPVRGYSNGSPKDVIVWMDSTQKSQDFANFGFMPDSIKIDPDGLLLMTTMKMTYSASVGTTMVEVSVPATRLRVFPNPNNQDLLSYSIDYPNASGDLLLILFDDAGHQVRTWTRTITKTIIQDSLNIAGLSAGNYRLYVRIPNEFSVSTGVTISR